MRSKLVWMFALVLAMLAYGAKAATRISTLPLLSAVTAAGPTPPGESALIQAHLRGVEAELLARDVSHLTNEQRLAREHNIRVLREYRERGVFPHNHDYEGRRVPYFVDAHGTLCAMAYLISRSGGDELVERIAATRNNARIPELATDTELIAWLDGAGLSAEEAARIQPAYGCQCGGEDVEDPSAVSAGYAVASALTSGVGGVSIGMNLLSLDSGRRSRWSGLLGIAAGAVGMGLGMDRLGDGGASAALGAANAGIGAASAALGAWSLVQFPRDRPAGGPPAAAATRSPSLSAAPWLAADAGGGVGVRLHMRF